jgi:DNA-binding CsgD family transcriptional regulator
MPSPGICRSAVLTVPMLETAGSGSEPTALVRRNFRQLQLAIAQLRELTEPGALLAAAPAQLGPHSPFERVVLHSIHDGVMTAETAWDGSGSGAGQGQLALLRTQPLALTHLLPETDMLRRRRPILVEDAGLAHGAQTHLATTMQWKGYVAAPLLIGTNPIGTLHADRGPGMDAHRADLELLWYFATVVGQAYERAQLRRTLRRERSRLRTTLAWLDHNSQQLTDASISLGLGDADRGDGQSLLTEPGTLGRSDSAIFNGVLTRRELEVLRLLSSGYSNKSIADELVISLGTAKFHVNRILGKLHAGNRSAAVVRYHNLIERGRLPDHP